MHPVDLASERERRTRKGYQQVARDVRRAAIPATDRERMLLAQVVIACEARALSPEQAHAEVARIRDGQRDRLTVRAA